MFEWVANPEAWVALATLTALEIVLGIDNIIFISIVVGRLPEERRNSARVIGLALAMITRIMLLLSLAWMMRLTNPLFTVFSQEISGRDIIMIPLPKQQNPTEITTRARTLPGRHFPGKLSYGRRIRPFQH